MKDMEIRKLQVVGNRSFSLSLPKQWVLKNGLKSKDTIFIHQTEDNDLLLQVVNKEIQEKKQVKVDLSEVKNIFEFITFCYVKNVDKIRFFWKEINYDSLREIKRVLTYLDGYDVVSQDEKSIEIAFLFKDVDITIGNITRRMIYLIKLMLDLLEEKDLDGVKEVEQSIDRLYHLSKRIIFSCNKSKQLRKQNNIRTEDDIFFFRDIVKKLENIGDILYDLRDINYTEKDIKTIKTVVGKVEELVKKPNTISKPESTNPSVSSGEVKNIIKRLNDLTRDLFENYINIYFNKKFFA